MQDDAKPIAWMYENEEGSRELILNCNGEYARRLLDFGYAGTPLYAHPPAPVQPADVERVSRAIHEHLCRRDIMQYLDNEEDCEGLARAALAEMPATSPADADAELVELVKLLADVLEKELGDRADPSLGEEELTDWLGEEYGRQTIAGRIRLNQARERLAALGQGGVR